MILRTILILPKYNKPSGSKFILEDSCGFADRDNETEFSWLADEGKSFLTGSISRPQSGLLHEQQYPLDLGHTLFPKLISWLVR